MLEASSYSRGAGYGYTYTVRLRLSSLTTCRREREKPRSSIFSDGTVHYTKLAIGSARRSSKDERILKECARKRGPFGRSPDTRFIREG